MSGTKAVQPLADIEEEDESVSMDILGFALAFGLPNVVRLPSLVQSYSGSVAFIIVWAFFMLITGLPLLFLETTLAFFSGRDAIGLWAAVPIMKGTMT